MSAITAPLRRSRPDLDRPADRHLWVVEEPVRRHTLAYAIVMVMLFAAAVFGAVTLNALAAGASVDARALERHVGEAERVYAQLVADVATLEDPARVRQAALELGMVPPGPVRHLTLERTLPADGAVPPARTPDATTDPLKPLLSQER
ncbi:MAG: hypothetical protein R6U94_08285 [Nitriliruptoraceae bacterium]